MKILIVTNGFPPTSISGVEVYSYDLAQGLMRRGHQVTVLCRVSGFSLPDYHISEAQEDGVYIIRVVNDFKKIYSFRESYLDGRIDDIFEGFLQKNRQDIIHFNHFIALSANLLTTAFNLKTPSIVTLHDFWPICHRINLIDWQGQECSGPENGSKCALCVAGGESHRRIDNSFNWFFRIIKNNTSPQFRNRIRSVFPSLYKRSAPLYSSADIFMERNRFFIASLFKSKRLLVPSRFVKQQYISNGFNPNSIEVIPLGINIELDKLERISATDLKSKNIRFGAVGSFLPIKGFDTLIKAFMTIPSESVSLDFYGCEDLIPPYTRVLKNLSQADQRIHFNGLFSPKERSQIYQNLDVLIIPSRVPETFSLVCREALVFGKPVIASAIGSLPEIISNGVNGFLFNPDDENELRNIILRITNNPGILSELQCPGPVSIPTIEEHIDEVERIYTQVIESNIRA